MSIADFLWITSCGDRLEHGIGDEAVSIGRRAGVYSAICGEQVLPRALVAECGPRCPHCAEIADPPPPPSRITRILRLL
jgi:hypothetical protein